MAEATAAPKAPKSTKPGEKGGDPAVKEKKVPVKKVFHPALNVDEKGKATTRLKEIPADFDSKVHKPIRRQDLENEAPLLDQMAARHEEAARKLRAEAEAARTLGSAADRAKMKRLQRMREQMAKLEGELASIPGVDIEKLRAQSAPKAPVAAAS